MLILVILVYIVSYVLLIKGFFGLGRMTTSPVGREKYAQAFLSSVIIRIIVTLYCYLHWKLSLWVFPISILLSFFVILLAIITRTLIDKLEMYRYLRDRGRIN